MSKGPFPTIHKTLSRLQMRTRLSRRLIQWSSRDYNRTSDLVASIPRCSRSRTWSPMQVRTTGTSYRIRWPNTLAVSLTSQALTSGRSSLTISSITNDTPCNPRPKTNQQVPIKSNQTLRMELNDQIQISNITWQEMNISLLVAKKT